MGLRYQIARILRDGAFVGHYRCSKPATETTIVTLGNLTNKSWTIAAQPITPMTVDVLVVDTTPSITAGTVTITGTGANGRTQVETVNCAAGAGTYVGNKPFAVITSIVTSGFTVLGGAGDETFHVHTGLKLGLPCDELKAVFRASVDDVYEVVGTVSTTYGTISPTTAINGTRNFDFWYTHYPVPEAY